MLIRELVMENEVFLAQCGPNDEDDFCNPVYCLPDAYDLCNPDMDEDGGCDPHYDNDFD